MSSTADLLVEIGTEELPPKALPHLMTAFADGMAEALDANRLAHRGIRPYGSPRRLAVVVEDLQHAQPQQVVEHRGPPVRVAFAEDGSPTAAATAFAAKCGVSVEALGRTRTDKGEWLSHTATEVGEPAANLLPAIVTHALTKLPIPRPMRWGAADVAFVRPVHWIVMLHGEHVVAGELLGVACGRTTLGHRFMAPGELSLNSPAEYVDTLETRGSVVVDFSVRRERIEAGVAAAAADCGGQAVTSDALFDEVTALVEWPVALAGRFDAKFLALPREVIVAVLTSHQRYFPVADSDGELLPAFVTVANLVSSDPQQVLSGNERVIHPRLADADFFWSTDRHTTLAERRDALDDVVYQRGLGSLGDKARRLGALAAQIAEAIGVDGTLTERAASLAKSDLLTNMVGEFPELQGTMGSYYAEADGEDHDVSAAIGEHYRPRFSGDAIAATGIGRCLAIADKLDSLCGSFALGKKPSGNRDPFGLRRAALGLVRTIVEGSLELDLKALIAASVAAQPVTAEDDVAEHVYDFVIDRLRAYCLEHQGVTAAAFDAVRARKPHSLSDFDARLKAVTAFRGLPSAALLASANKRIANILRQADYSSDGTLDASLLSEEAERELHQALETARADVAPLFERRDYTQALSRLADLQEPVDRFFDDVMVMTDDDTLRQNRLSLLASLREQFLRVADISQLSVN